MLADTLAICETVTASIQAKLPNVIIESDSHNVIRAIICAIKAPSIISNTCCEDCVEIFVLYSAVVEIFVLYSAVRDIKFIYYDRHANMLADTIARKAQHCNAHNVFIYQ